jgi:ABC-type transport system substrate-binding protein
MAGRTMRTALAGLAVAALLAGCGGSGGGPASNPSSAGDEPDLQATLRWAAVGDGGGNYDPHTANNPGSTQYLSPAYDRLVYLNPDGQLQPMLATSWTVSPDGLAVTFELRPNVTFHDGARFDAAAVKANIERAKTVDRSSARADLASVQSVEVLADLRVRFNLNAPNSALPSILSDRPGMMISPAAFTNPDLALKPVGAGPYKVVQVQPGSLLAFERFDGYWDPNAQKLKRIEMTMQLDSETRLRSLVSGQADAMLLFADQVDEVRKAGLVVGEAPNVPQVQMLFLNKARGAFDKADARRAVSHAIDRQAISDALFDGKCKPTSQPFSSDGPYADPQTKVDAYDPNLARQLLAKAGVPNGFEFDSVMANVSWLVTEAEAVQAQLAKVGIRMKVQPLEPAQVLGRFLTEKSADSWFSALQSQVDPAKTAIQALLPASVYNPGGYDNATITRLAAEGAAAGDPAARGRAYQQISSAFAADTFNVAICSLPTFSASAQKVHGLRPNLTNTFDLREVWIGKGR